MQHQKPFLTVFFLSIFSIAAQDFSALEYRNVGPYRGGRVTAVAGIASQPGTFYFGATGGGVWKTEDYGTSWGNISDGYFKTPSIGAISVAQNDPNVLYVGTGSDGLRSNVIEGMGVYKSIDAGVTWQHAGLQKTGQIGGVRLHPMDYNTVYVAAIGKAFQPNAERGLYKTTDGGKTWKQVLFISERTGVSDVELLPTNPNVVFAAAWKAERKPWTIISGGTPQEGGIYKSLDGGNSWSRIEKGLPSELIGKIDIEVCPSDSRIVYALVEAPGEEGGLYKSVDQGESFTQVSSHDGIRTRPFYYTNIKVDPKDPDILYAMATGYFKSEDGGRTWKRMRPPHGDNHDMWINPDNPDLFIQSNDGGANVTHNGGQTWSTQFNQPTAELYQVEVDNQHPYWLYGGQQDNYTTVSVPSMPPYGVQASGTGYIVNTGGCETGPAVPHPTNPDIVYSNCKGRFTVYNKRTGTEQSYYVGASNMYGHNPKDLKYRFQRVSPIHVSPHNPSVIYHTSQFVHKTTDEGKTWETISPDLTAFEPDKQVISGSPITRDITGEEFYSTIYAIRESPIQEGLIWVGANDGPVHVTRDGGQNWEDVTPRNLPPGGRVDAVEPSPHDPAKAYIAVLRYQLGDPKPYIYKTENYGRSWTLLTGGENGIPDNHPARVVREDPVREGLLFAGTEYGVYVSWDDGTSWRTFQQNLPVTPVSDMKIHRGDLVLSTMGRSFWILDQISVLRQGDFSDSGQPVLYKPQNGMRYRTPSGAWGSDTPEYPRPGVLIDYYLPEPAEGPLKLQILDANGLVITAFASDSIPGGTGEAVRDMGTNFTEFMVADGLTNKKGLNRFRWDMTHAGPWNKSESRRYRNGPMAAPGQYTAVLTAGDRQLRQGDFSDSGQPVLYKPQNGIRYRTPSGAWGSDTPEYPRPGVLIDYYLPEPAEGPLKLQILDANGLVITAFASDSIPGGTGEAVRDMGTNFTEFMVADGLTNKKGLNRFRWDMTHAGPWNKSESRRYRNGPMAAPGQYTAVLTVGDRQLRQGFELEMDPRVLASGVTEADVRTQVDFQLKVRDRMSEVLALQEELDVEIGELEKVAGRSPGQESRLQELKSAMAKVRTDEGIYMQPMLADQWSYLYSMMNQADQVPGQDALDRYAELITQLETLKSEVKP